MEGFTVKVDEKGLTGGHIVKTYGSWPNVEAIQMVLRYTSSIENREFGEEEVEGKNEELFVITKQRLIKVFRKIKVGIEELSNL